MNSHLTQIARSLGRAVAHEIERVLDALADVVLHRRQAVGGVVTGEAGDTWLDRVADGGRNYAIRLAKQ